MSSVRAVHDVAQQMENSDNLPCFASLSLNERPVTNGILPRTQSIEVAKRDALGNIIPNKYTQKKYDENMEEMKKKNATSLWSYFYGDNVHPENRKEPGYENQWPPNMATNNTIPHFLRSEWASKKGGCPDSIEQALDIPEMKEWVTKQNETIRMTYEEAKSNATPDNLINFREALRMKAVLGLPVPPGFVHYTYVRKLQIDVSDMPTRFFENKYFGPEWKQWFAATKDNSQYCEMKDASSPREAWERFLGIYLQDNNKRNLKKTSKEAQQPAEQVHNNQQPQPPSGQNDEENGADRLVDGFFAQSPQAPPNAPPNANELLQDLGPLAPTAPPVPPQIDEPDIPPEPKGNSVNIDEKDILKLLQQLP